MRHWTLVFILLAFTSTVVAQSHDKQVRAQVDSALTARYYQNKGDIDSTYIASKDEVDCRCTVERVGCED